MKWFKNLKVGTKLLSSFLVIALIASVIGFVGYNAVDEVGNVRLPSVSYLLHIEKYFVEVEVEQYRLIDEALSYDERQAVLKNMQYHREAMKKYSDLFLELPWTAEEEEIWGRYETELAEWEVSLAKFLGLVQRYDDLGIDNPKDVLLNVSMRNTDHVRWIWQMQTAIATGGSFQGQLDGNACALGQWLDNYSPRSDAFKQLMTAIDVPHMAVHRSGSDIVNILNSNSENRQSQALAIYNTVTLANMTSVLDTLAQMTLLAEESLRIIDEMNYVLENELVPEFLGAMDTLEELVDLNIEVAERAVTSSIVMVLSFIAVGVLLSIGLGVFISNIIKKPIAVMVKAAQQMADGDLDVSININTKDEVGILASAFSAMAENVNEVMSNINSASEQVAAGSSQVSDSSMSLSQGATEQASSIEELTASIEEIASQTRLNADNAMQANKLAESTKESALEGNSQMQQMLSSMSDINDSSNSISKIIKVIDEIAFQTNILALNAAVEAARAGEHGKGFAVVAEEVRNLAARSANAAKETTDLIEGSIQKVAKGTSIANQTASALNTIVQSIQQVTNLVSDIAVASNEQAQGVEQINQGISQIADVVQTTSATSEETAAASEELSSQAELLKQQVARFKLKKSYRRSKSGDFDDMNPEILRLIENLRGKEQRSTENEKTFSLPNNTTKKIVLSDKDFGKY